MLNIHVNSLKQVIFPNCRHPQNWLWSWSEIFDNDFVYEDNTQLHFFLWPILGIERFIPENFSFIGWLDAEIFRKRDRRTDKAIHKKVEEYKYRETLKQK